MAQCGCVVKQGKGVANKVALLAALQRSDHLLVALLCRYNQAVGVGVGALAFASQKQLYAPAPFHIPPVRSLPQLKQNRPVMPVEKCSRCRRTAACSRCARCRTVAYCSTDCQRQDWKAHKPACASTAKATAASRAPSPSASPPENLGDDTSSPSIRALVEQLGQSSSGTEAREQVPPQRCTGKKSAY